MATPPVAKQIRIPATLTDIGNDAFMYCSGLETVVVFGGKRTNAALEIMKEHFPENVDIQWEGEEQKVSKGLQTSKKTNTTSSKKASSSENSGKTSPGKSKKAATGSKKKAPAEEGNSVSYTFKPRVILSLPGDEFSIKEIDEGLHEGEVEITSTKYNDENDSKIEFHCKVDEPWGSENDVFGRIEGWFSSVYSFTERYQTTPKSHVMINTSMLRLNIAISKDEVLRIEADWLFGEPKFKEAASQLMAIWNGLMINGRKVSFGSHSIDWFADRWVEVYKEENRKSNEEAERKHNQSIERGKEKAKAHTAEYNDRLSFVLPDGTDLIKKEKDDGTELKEIAMHVLVDEDGDVSYETLIVLFDLFNQDGESNVDDSKISVESILQAAPGCRHYKLCDSPDTTLVVSDSMITFIGKDVKIVNLDVFVSYAPNHIFQMHYAEALDKIRNNKAENIQLMINAIRMMRIDGKALDVINVNYEELGQQLILNDFEAESSGTVGLKIVVNGKEIQNDENSESDDEDDSSPMSSPKIADGKYAGYIIENGRIRGNNKKLTKIDIPDGVTGIEDNAFEGYKSLIEVTIPDSVTYIGDSAFNGCSKLTKIVIPEGVEYINMFTFNECKNLVEVILPDTIQWIGLYAFSECTKLAKINLPDSIRTIYSSAFQGCASLTQITIPEGIDEINGSTFDGCKKLESIVIPDTVTEIGADAFSECEKLTKVHIPDDVHSIGRRVFSGCVRLEQVNIPADISVIEDGMFNGCKKLKSITIPAGVTSIGEDAFSNCECLTEIIIPEGVESIGDDAFRACKRIKRLKIPSTVKEIGVRAFYQCAGLTEVSIPEGIDRASCRTSAPRWPLSRAL